MTNTIFGLLSLLFVITITTLWLSCNRNNTKTESKTANETTDTLTKTADTLSNSIVKETPNDSLIKDMQADSIPAIISDNFKKDTINSDDLSLKEKNKAPEKIEKKAETNEPKTAETQPTTKNKSAADFKENINQPTTKSGGGLKAANNIKEVLSDNRPSGRLIVFGSGGGVTGAVSTYELYENGSLYENSSLNLDISQKKLSAVKGIKEIQNQFEALKIDDINLNAPGNIYFFVGYEKDGKTHRCTWGANDVIAPENLKLFYENLMNIISKNQ